VVAVTRFCRLASQRRCPRRHGVEASRSGYPAGTDLSEQAQTAIKSVEDRPLASLAQEQQRDLCAIPRQVMIAMGTCFPDPVHVIGAHAAQEVLRSECHGPDGLPAEQSASGSPGQLGGLEVAAGQPFVAFDTPELRRGHRAKNRTTWNVFASASTPVSPQGCMPAWRRR
jgi:hypothetical protein